MPTPKGAATWNAGTGKGWIDKRGYRWLYVDENGRRVARREHRVLMERHLGRKLEPWELVHHIDGDKSNNDLSNLELTEFGAHTVEHHTGSRRSEDARRSMEAFALLREELKRERQVKSELLEALIDLDNLRAGCGADELGAISGKIVARFVERYRAAISKAKGLPS